MCGAQPPEETVQLRSGQKLTQAVFHSEHHIGGILHRTLSCGARLTVLLTQTQCEETAF